MLNDVGILPRIKRYAGASAGAMTAALLAVGYTPEEVGGMQEFNNQYYAEGKICKYCKSGYFAGMLFSLYIHY